MSSLPVKPIQGWPKGCCRNPKALTNILPWRVVGVAVLKNGDRVFWGPTQLVPPYQTLVATVESVQQGNNQTRLIDWRQEVASIEGRYK